MSGGANQGRQTRLERARAMLDAGEVNPFAQGGRRVVAIDRVMEDPRNERKTFRNMDGLVASVRAMGVVEPPTVVPATLPGGGEGYVITTGHRRYRAAKLAGLTEIEVLVRDPEAELLRRRKSIVSNVQREDVGPVELAEGLQSLLDEDESIRTQRDLAAAIGKPEDWVSAMLRVLTLPAGLQAKLGASQVPVPYDAAVKISRERDGGFQAELVDDVLGGATAREVREKIRSRKAPKASAGGAKASATFEVGGATVTIRATDGRPLTPARQTAALRAALAAAGSDGR